MAKIIYQCAVDNKHPKKTLFSEPVVPPNCCSKPMVKVPAPEVKKNAPAAGEVKPPNPPAASQDIQPKKPN